jgi:hypothetical protein
MTPATLEVNVDAKGKFTVAMLITELLDAELLISPPELDGGLFCLEALSDAMPIQGKVFIAERLT